MVLRILGLSSDHPLCLDSRKRLHELGGATSAPAWGKFWLAVLNVYDWSGMDPIPPELWCLPDWLPIHPRRWWVQARMVYLPMGYLYGKRFKVERNALVDSLRQVSSGSRRQKMLLFPFLLIITSLFLEYKSHSELSFRLLPPPCFPGAIR